MSENDFWELTLGQFYKLCDRRAIEFYQCRFDIAYFHSTFFNANSKQKISVKNIIGDFPDLSDVDKRKESVKAIKEAFKQIFPEQKGEISQEAKKRVERYLRGDK